MRAMEDRAAVQIEARQMLTHCKKNWTDCLAWEQEKGDLSDVENTLGKMKYLQNLVNG